jgi:hypothetical protein
MLKIQSLEALDLILIVAALVSMALVGVAVWW